MNLTDLKLASFESLSQAILFDESGVVVNSDNTLFELAVNSSNVFEKIDLFQGMEDIIKRMNENDELVFRCVHTAIMDQESHFDFIIKRLPVPDKGTHCLLVYDFKEQYKKVFELQQERNVRDIETKRLVREKRVIQEEKEAVKNLYDQLLQSNSTEFIFIKSDNLLVNIDLNDVLYFEAYGDYIKVHTNSKMYVIYNRMKNVESQLPPGKFQRIHRSYIVPLDKIRNIEQMSLNIADKILPIGNNYKQDLLNQLKQI